VLTTSGHPLNTPNHQPELRFFLSGAQHSDGSRIALSHAYPNVSVIFADIVGMERRGEEMRRGEERRGDERKGEERRGK
jgi:hypothetical protein